MCIYTYHEYIYIYVLTHSLTHYTVDCQAEHWQLWTSSAPAFKRKAIIGRAASIQIVTEKAWRRIAKRAKNSKENLCHFQRKHQNDINSPSVN